MANVEMDLLHCLERLPCDSLLMSPQLRRKIVVPPMPFSAPVPVGQKRRQDECCGSPCHCSNCSHPAKRQAFSPLNPGNPAASPSLLRLRVPQLRVAPQSPAIPPVSISRPALLSAPMPQLQHFPVRPPPPTPKPPTFNAVPPPVLSAKACALSRHSQAPIAATLAQSSSPTGSKVPSYPSAASSRAQGAKAAPVDPAQRLSAAMQALQSTPLARLLSSPPGPGVPQGRAVGSPEEARTCSVTRAVVTDQLTAARPELQQWAVPRLQPTQAGLAARAHLPSAAPSPLSLPPMPVVAPLNPSALLCPRSAPCSCGSCTSSAELQPATPPLASPAHPVLEKGANTSNKSIAPSAHATTNNRLLDGPIINSPRSRTPSPECQVVPWAPSGLEASNKAARKVAAAIDINAAPAGQSWPEAEEGAAADLLLLCQGEAISAQHEEEQDGGEQGGGAGQAHRTGGLHCQGPVAAAAASPAAVHCSEPPRGRQTRETVAGAQAKGQADASLHVHQRGEQLLLCHEQGATAGDENGEGCSYSASFSLEWSEQEASSASSTASCCSSGNPTEADGATSRPPPSPSCKVSLQVGTEEGAREERRSCGEGRSEREEEGESSFVTKTASLHSNRWAEEREDGSEYEEENDDFEENYDDYDILDLDCMSESK